MKIVQIGCNDCDDHVKEYVHANNDSVDQLILVDPQINNLNECQEIYANVKNLILINKAITTTNENSIILYTNPVHDPKGIHNSYDRNHLVGHRHDMNNVVSKEYPAVNINTILEEYNCQILDRLYIDTEGYDIEILKSIEWDKYTIKYIRFEFIHCEGPFSGMSKTVKEFEEYLKQNNYTTTNNGWDMEATLNDRN